VIAEADILVTSARARAFPALGLSADALFARNPGLVWVAITGHGWASDRVGFGDDTAAAGGLVRWTAEGAPRFVGDAVADPLTGMAAAAVAMAALAGGGGVLVDAALSRVAAASRINLSHEDLIGGAAQAAYIGLDHEKGAMLRPE